MNRLRKTLGIALCVVLIVLDTALAAWLLRGVWLVPIVRRELEAVLGTALSAEVRLGGIEGTLLKDVQIDGIDLQSVGPGGVLQIVEGARISAAFDALALANGDLSALRHAEIEARRVEIRLPEGGAPGEEHAAADPWPEPDVVRPWLELLPDGATVRAEQLVVRDPAGQVLVAGPFRATLSPRPRRRASIAVDDVQLEVLATPDGLFHVDAAVPDPPERLRMLGTELPLAGGRLDLEVEGDLRDRELRGTFAWTGGVLRDRGPSRIHGAVHVRRESLEVDLDAEGPGGRIEAHDLAVALADVDDFVRTARGSLELEVRDLEPWRPLLPDVVAERMPIRGRLRAALDGRGLAVGAGSLRGRGFTLRIERGHLPFGRPDVERARGSLAAELTLDEPLTIAVADEEVVVTGTARGVVEGTLEDPEVSATLSLGEGHAFGRAWSSLRGEASLSADDTITVTSLDLTGARPETAAAVDGATARGEVTVRLPSNDRPAVALEVDLDVEGPVAPWLAAHAPEVDPERRLGVARLAVAGAVAFTDTPLPTGDARVRIDALAVADEAQPMTGTVTARADPPTDGDQAFALSVDASLDPTLLRLAGVDTEPWIVRDLVPTRAALSGTFGAEGAGELTAAVQIDELQLPGSPPARIGADVSRAADGTVTIETLSVRGPIALDATGRLPPTGSDEPLDVDVNLQIEDTTHLGAFVRELPPGGRVTVAGKLGGTWAVAEGDIRVDARFRAAPAPVVDRWPAELGPFPDGPVSLAASLSARAGAVVVDELSLVAGDGGTRSGIAVRARGDAPIRIGPDGLAPGDGALTGSLDVAVEVPSLGPGRLSTPVSWGTESLALEKIVIGGTIADVTGRLVLRDPGRALAGEPIGSLGLEGTLNATIDDVTRLPAGWQPTRILGGSFDAAVDVGGTLAAPAPRGRVTLTNARLKLAADVPIVDDVRAVVRFDPALVELEQLSANAGVGTVKAQGTLTAAEGTTLTAAPDRATLDLSLTADEALLIRATGKKLRGDARIRAHGNLDRIDVTGDLEIHSGRFIRRISLVPEVGTRGGVTTGTGLELFEIEGPLGEAIHFDVAVRTTEPIDIVTYVFNSSVTASVRLRGTGEAPYLDGAVSTSSGSLRLPALTLSVSQGLMTFAADEPKNPRILLRASTRRHGIDVSMTATGRLSDPEILLSSLPPLTQQELFVLVSTGVLPETLQEQGLRGRATMVGGYVAQEIFEFYFGSESTEQGESIIDRFHFYSGREISRNGVESLVIDFDLTDNVALEGERDIYEDYNMGVLYRIRF